MKLTLTRDDVFRAAVEGCQPSTIAIERTFAEGHVYVTAAQVNPSLAYVWTFNAKLELHMPYELAYFNAAYRSGEVTTLNQPMEVEVY